MSDIAIKSKIKLRTDTSTNWSTVNPVLLLGESGYESDTGRLKIGDGTSNWNDLKYQIESTSNKVTMIDSSSTDDQYPSAKCIYGMIGDVESILKSLDSGEGV